MSSEKVIPVPKKPGKGWHGSSAAHAAAGRMGGLKRAENRKKAKAKK